MRSYRPGSGMIQRPDKAARSKGSEEPLGGAAMRVDDLILVSVDDHVVEPPDMFERHVPSKWRDQAPKSVRKPEGHEVWVFEGNEIPNIGLNAVAGRPPEDYNMDVTSYD